MDDEEEYDSEYSDSTVLLTDYVDKPEKIDMKRQRLSNLLDRGNQSDPHEEENILPDDVSVKQQTDNFKKRRDIVDKDWHVSRYLACINKNNDCDMQNDDSNKERNVDIKQTLTNFQQQGNMLKENTLKIGNNNEIICLDSDDETQVDEPVLNQDKDSARISAMNDCDRNATSEIPKSASVSARRFTTDVIEQNNICEDSQRVVKKKRAIIRVLKPSAINARRATTHFEYNNVDCESAKRIIIIPTNKVQSTKEKVADGINNTSPKATEVSNKAGNPFNNFSLDSNDMCDTAADNEQTSSVNASKNKTDINENDSTSNENLRQDITKSPNEKVNKRLASNNEVEREPKRLKSIAESKLMGSEQSTKDIQNPAMKLNLRSKLSKQGVNVRNEQLLHCDEHKTDEQVKSKGSDEHEENVKTPRGVVNKLFENGTTISESLDKQETVKLRGENVISECSHKEVINEIHDKVVTDEARDKQGSNKIQTNERAADVPNILEVNKVQGNQDVAKALNTLELCKLQNVQKISTVHDTEETNDVQGTQGTIKVQNEAGKQRDEQETSTVHDKQEASKELVNQSATNVLNEIKTKKLRGEGYDKDATGKVRNELREKQLVKKISEAQDQEETSKILDKAVRRKSSDEQEIMKSYMEQEVNKQQDKQQVQACDKSDANKHDKKVTNSLPQKLTPCKEPNALIVSKTSEKQKKCKVLVELDTTEIQNEHMPSAPSNKPQLGAEHNKLEVSKVQDKTINKICDTLKPQKANSNDTNIELDIVQEVVTDNKTRNKAASDDGEENNRILRFQVGFFTLIKEYLKEIFPESAKILHDLIKTLIVDTEKGQVQTDVRYSCPKCSRVSNYSSSIIFNTQNNENKASAVASPDCGFCRGIRKMHTSYLKRFLGKKDSIDNNNKNVRKACAEKDHVKHSAEQSANSSIRGSTSNNSPKTSVIKKYSNSATTSAAVNSNFSSIVDDKKQKRITLTQGNCDVNAANHDVLEKRLVHKKTPLNKTSQLELTCSFTGNNLKKGEQEDTRKEVSDHNSPITTDNETPSQQFSKMKNETAANIILGISSKRKDNEDKIQKADLKRMKTDRKQSTVQNVENLTPNVNQTNIEGNDRIADEHPNKVVILSIQNLTSRTAEKVNNSLGNNNDLNDEKSAVTSSLDTEASCTANHEYSNGNTLEKPSNTPKEKEQINTSDGKCTQEIPFKPSNSNNVTAAEAGGLGNRNKHVSETDDKSIKKLTIENMAQNVVGNEIRNENNTEREGKVDENDRQNENASDKLSIDTIPKTVEENNNTKQIQHPKENDKDNERIIKSLVDSFERIKSNVVANDSSAAETNENIIKPGSTPKRRNSLDSLPNSETKRKIIVKYICPICTCAYVYPSKFSNHIKKQHHLNYTTIPESCIRLQCPYCPVISLNKNYNKHVKQYHPEKFEERVENVNTMKIENTKCGPIKNKKTNPEINKAFESPNPKYIDNIDKRDDGENKELAATRSEEKNNYDHTGSTSNVNSIRNNNLDETGKTRHEKLGSKIDKTKIKKLCTNEKGIAEKCTELSTTNNEILSNTSDTSKSTSTRDTSTKETNALMRIGGSPLSNYNQIDNITSVSNENEPLEVSFLAENRKHQGAELSTEDKRSGEHCRAIDKNAAIEESSEISCPNICKETEPASYYYLINASHIQTKKGNMRTITLFADKKDLKDALVQNKINEELRKEQENKNTMKVSHHVEIKKRKTRTITLFADKSEALLQNKIYEEAIIEQENNEFTNKEDRILLKNRDTHKDTANSDRNNDEAHRRRQVTVEKYIESPESSNGDKTITSTYDSPCTVKSKDQVVRKLFSDGNEPFQNGGSCYLGKLNGQNGTELLTKGQAGDNQSIEMKKSNDNNNSTIHDDVTASGDDETVKSSKHTAKKRKKHLSKLFGDNYETSVSENDGDKQGQKEQNEENTRHTSDQNCEVIGEDNDDSVSNNRGKEVPSVNKNVNGLHNAETRTHDNDQVEIDMIDSLLNELDVHTPVTQQNGACAEKEDDVNDKDSPELRGNKSSEVNKEIQKENCLENIQITNVTSITNKIHIFVCQECNYGTDVYDNAICHCQNHYNRIEDQVTYCNTCQINYDRACFERHQTYHDNYLGNIKIKFSYQWLFTNWQSVFDTNTISLNEAEEMQVKSIYKTFCVKLTVKEDGLWQSAVYVCAKCNTCIPPINIEEHVQQQCVLTSYLCGVCDRAFLTREMQEHHEIYHKLEENQLFKTIVFNDKCDEIFNATLLQAKAKNNQKAEIVDIYKCLCGLCFNTMKRFKLHFVDCDSEISDGEQCPCCSGVQRFSSAELEEHVSLHESLFKYKFSVKQIMFQQEFKIDDLVQETPSETSYNTENATQIRSNDKELNIEDDMLKKESLTQDTYEEHSPEIENGAAKEAVTKDPKVVTVMDVSDSSKENSTQVRYIDVDLEIKRDMLKDESLTQSSIENNIQEIPNTDDKEEIQPSQNINELEVSKHSINTEGTQEIIDAAGSENPVIIEASQAVGGAKESERLISEEKSQEIMQIAPQHRITEATPQANNEVEESAKPTIIEPSKETNKVPESEQLIIIESSQETEVQALQETMEIGEPEGLTTEANQDKGVNESDQPTIQTSQDMAEEIMDVDDLDDPITIDDSDDEVEFVGEERSPICSTPTLAGIIR